MKMAPLVLALANMLYAQSNPVLMPGENPDKWILSFIDVETTGLVPGYNEMIDIGVVLATLDGVEIARTFVRVMPNYPERTAPEVPAINGFESTCPSDSIFRLIQNCIETIQIFFVSHELT